MHIYQYPVFFYTFFLLLKKLRGFFVRCRVLVRVQVQVQYLYGCPPTTCVRTALRSKFQTMSLLLCDYQVFTLRVQVLVKVHVYNFYVRRKGDNTSNTISVIVVVEYSIDVYKHRARNPSHFVCRFFVFCRFCWLCEIFKKIHSSRTIYRQNI